MGEESGGGGGGLSKPGGGGGTPKPEGGGGGGGAGGGARLGRELGEVGEVTGGAGGGWLGLSMLTRFWDGAPCCPSLYLQKDSVDVKDKDKLPFSNLGSSCSLKKHRLKVKCSFLSIFATVEPFNLE